MPEDDSTISQEVIADDNRTSFLETALKVIKTGAYTTGAMWVGAGVGKVAIDIVYKGEVDTVFLEQAWNTLTPVFVGFITTLIGWFIRDQAN